MDDDPARQVTDMLARIGSGDDLATEELLRLLYSELRALAGGFFREQNPGQTLQPTALVHEAYLKLNRTPSGGWESRAHFFAVAAKAMRQILANHAELPPRQARVVELRFLAGLEEREIAHVVGLSTHTVEREWRMARAVLRCERRGDRLT